MAEIPVTKKRSSSWWIWLLGLILLAALIWYLFGTFGDPDRTATAPSTTAPAATTAPAPAPGATTAPAAQGTTTDTASTAAPATSPQTGAPPATGEVITDSGAYASAGDKLSLVGRRAELTGARVARVVGPKTFTLVSGSEEMYVMVDDDLSKGVGTQGQIDKGSVLSVKGTFRRLTAEEVRDMADNRFRDLTAQEREALEKRQVYLHATEFSKIS